MTGDAADLRAAFDAAFAAAPVERPPPQLEVLRVRAGGTLHTLALATIASLHAGLRIVTLPAPSRVLLGVVAVRGAIIPVYDLAGALGAGASPGAPHWLAIARGGEAGFAFDGFEDHARVAPDHPAIDLVTLLDRISDRIGEDQR